MSIPPGLIELTLIFFEAKLTASHLVKYVKPALLVEYPAGLFILLFLYISSFGGIIEYTDDIFIIEGKLDLLNLFDNFCDNEKTDDKFNLKTSSQFSVVCL